MIKVHVNPTNIDIKKLDEFTLLHPNSHFFQSRIAYEIFSDPSHQKPYLIIAEENGEIVGSMLTVLIKEGGGALGFFSRRFIVYGAPLIKDEDNEIITAILDAFNKLAKRLSIYSQLRNHYDTNHFKNIFNQYGWMYEEHLNILVNLTKTEDELWKDVYSKRRNEIRRARKEGTTFRIVKGEEEFAETYNILKEVYDHAQLPLPSFEYFKKASKILTSKHFIQFVAINENRIIRTMYALCFNGKIYDWYAGSFRNYYNKYPNDLIPWEVFLWGKNNSYREFDFGGAGHPQKPYGVRDYKKKFGGEFTNFGRYEKIHKPVLFNISKLGFAIYRKYK